MSLPGIIKGYLNRKTKTWFRNQLGYKVNLSYWAFQKYAQLKSRISSTKKDIETAKAIKRDGVAILGVSDVNEMAAIVEGVFKTIPVVNGYAAYPTEKNNLIAPLLFKVIMEHSGAIRAYFGSNFRVNWVECQKTSSEGKQPDGSSFSYHTDDTPAPIVKLFIYLTDTYEDNAAFRAFSYQITDELIKKGILVTATPGEKRMKAQHLVSKELEKNLNIIEGPKGTVFIFDNNLIHKGTNARRGYRIHMSMEIMPFPEPLTYESFYKRCIHGNTGEYFHRQPFDLLKLKD
jgi:hypothetical protein